jgi:anthranilate phosphoribosyltransferase
LTEDETAAAFDMIMRGEASAAQVAAVLVGLRVKGETAAEIAGGARALRSAMVHLPASDPDGLVDTCGTGGGKVPTFNVSTAAALLAAGLGVRIAKHGNRSFTTSCGSADVLEALGVRIDLTPDEMANTLSQAGIVFMFAPLMHPAMRHVGPVRSELGIATLMNVLGPLANPAGAGRQVVGVSDPARLSLLANALASLGSIHALVVHGEPGMDEISPMGATRVAEVVHGEVREWTLDPVALGIETASAGELAGGSPLDNARLITAILEGKRQGGARTAVLLNTAAALYVAGKVGSYDEGLKAAATALADGAGITALDRLRAASNNRAQ